MKQFYSFKTLKILPGISAIDKTVNKVASYKINIENLVMVLYTNDKHTVKENRKTVPFRIDSEYLRITPIKQVKSYITETLRPRRKKSNNTSKDEKLSHAHGS